KLAAKHHKDRRLSIDRSKAGVDMRTMNHGPTFPCAAARRWLMTVGILMVWARAAAAPAAANPPAEPPAAARVGRVIRVTAPITTGLARRVGQEAEAFIKQQQGKQHVLIFEIQP